MSAGIRRGKKFSRIKIQETKPLRIPRNQGSSISTPWPTETTRCHPGCQPSRRSAPAGGRRPNGWGTENKLRYDQEISRIKQQIERLEEADKSFYVTATYLLQLFKHGEKIFEVASHDEKRELLKLVLSNLELKGKTVRFTPNEPFATVLKLSERSTWQGYMDEDRTFYSVSENAILGVGNV